MNKFIMLALLLPSLALATPPPPPSNTAHTVGVGIAVATSNNSVESVNTNTSELAQHQTANSNQTQSASSNQTQSANNQGNAQSTHITSNAVRNAPAIALGAVFPTAGCQGGVGLGGSGVNGGGLLNFSYTKNECETVVLAQNFAAIGMPETSCDILKTTKAWQRAIAANPQIAASCEPKPAAVPLPTKALPPTDLAVYVTRDELNEVAQRIISTTSSK